MKRLTILGFAIALLGSTAFAGDFFHPYIVNGEPVASSDPIGKSTVALYILKPTAENPHAIHNFCSGTLITPQIVMTAAHCFADYAQDENTTVDEIRSKTSVGFGLPVIQDPSQAGVEFRAISAIVIHPDYVPNSSQFAKPDIALLRLSTPAPNSAVAAKLVEDGELLQSGLKIVLAGFGKVDGVHNVAATQLMKTVVTVDKGYYSKYQFTYHPVAGRSACRGDSGGPAYLLDGAAQPSVIGITSWGDANCEEGGAYTSVPAMLGWIRSLSSL